MYAGWMACTGEHSGTNGLKTGRGLHSSLWMRSRAFGSHLHAYVRLYMQYRVDISTSGQGGRADLAAAPRWKENGRTGGEGICEELSGIHDRD